MIKLTECPRDAMQGLHDFVPTDVKAKYINLLLQVGFDTIDFGSFVSPKAIPQMRDTTEVLAKLDLGSSRSKLLAIVASYRGAEDATKFNEIAYLGFPFSISETFQLRNTNKTIANSLELVDTMQELCIKNSKQLVIYISMGFGNPYGDPYDAAVALEWVEKLVDMDIVTISLADTVGVATPDTITQLFSTLIKAYPVVEFGAHFHSAPHNWEEKVAAAYNEGCRRFDSAIKGIGGCPMAKHELVGNLATERLLEFCLKQHEPLQLDMEALQTAQRIADRIFY